MLFGIKPQNFLAAVIMSLIRSDHSGCVVAGSLGSTCTAYSSADVVLLNKDAAAVQLALISCIVRTYCAQNDDEEILLGRKY